jgi:hypothetical protein
MLAGAQSPSTHDAVAKPPKQFHEVWVGYQEHQILRISLRLIQQFYHYSKQRKETAHTSPLLSKLIMVAEMSDRFFLRATDP